MKSRYEAPRTVQETAQAEFLISTSTTGQNVYTDDPKTTEDALTKESQGAWDIEW